MKKIGVVANIKRAYAVEMLERVYLWCEKNQLELTFSQETADFFGSQGSKKIKVRSVSKEDLWKNSDIILAMGGDGTILTTARAVAEHKTPILGINLGGLGFMTQVKTEDLENALERIKNKDYQIEARMVLQTSFGKKNHWYALNEVVIEKGEISRLIDLHISTEKEFIGSFSADGLIIATPTGSTAYSMSAGGPIVNPKMEAIILSPICPQSLAVRPIVFPAQEVIKVKVETRSEGAIVKVDGQMTGAIKSGAEILIQKALHTINLITFPERSFFEILRQKLHWGVKPKAGS